jgi:hypothetical protein
LSISYLALHLCSIKILGAYLREEIEERKKTYKDKDEKWIEKKLRQCHVI